MRSAGLLLFAVGGLACPLLPAFAASGLDARVRMVSGWGFGAVWEIDIENNGHFETADWRLLVDIPGPARGLNGVRAIASTSDAVLVEAVDWNRRIVPGGKVVVGMKTFPGNVRPRVRRAEAVHDLLPVEPDGPVETVPFPKQNSPVDLRIEQGGASDAYETRVMLTNRSWKKLRFWELAMGSGPEIRPLRGVGVTARQGARTLLGPVSAITADIPPGGSISFALAAPVGVPEPQPSIQGLHALLAPSEPRKPVYAEALSLSLLFYEAQRSGRLPADNRVPWRGNSALRDGSDVGVDLTGGYYDAGDHVKFAFPQAAALTLLAWGGIEYPDGYNIAGQWNHLASTVRWGTDWLLKAHTGPREFFAQVGEAAVDHALWAPPEKMRMPRRSFRITADQPGSDLAGEAAASLAAASLLFAAKDPPYSERCLASARELFNFADNFRGSYSDVIPDAGLHYHSSNGFLDELAWAAAWLYSATGEKHYLKRAEQLYGEAVTGPLVGGLFSWDDKRPGLAVLLARLTGRDPYRRDAEEFLNSWVDGTEGVTHTPGGLAWRDGWGALRYSANTAFLALIHADHVRDPAGLYSAFAKRQIDYILGANPAGRSYLVGFGRNPPKNPHHRAAHGSQNGSIDDPPVNRNVLAGGLVGGPGFPDDFSFVDDRRDPRTTEVALDYNAAFSGALARLNELDHERQKRAKTSRLRLRR